MRRAVHRKTMKTLDTTKNNKTRNNNYNDWLSVGMCLHNINSNYLLLWMKWSQQSNKYEDGICEEKWKLTLATPLGF